MFTNIHKHSSIFIESNAGKLPSERAETLQISGHPDAHVDHGILTDLVRSPRPPQNRLSGHLLAQPAAQRAQASN